MIQKHIVVNIVRDHQSLMIGEARKLDAESTMLNAQSGRLWVEIKKLTTLIEKLDDL